MLRPDNIRVIGTVGLVRNSIGEDCFLPDEVIMSRSGKLVQIGNTDAEGRMVMGDILYHVSIYKYLILLNTNLITSQI